MRDVAHLAGVSHQTVSRVINDHPNVRSETRARVLAAMRALDYQPNVAARTLATNRSQAIGLVTFDTTLFGPSFMVHAIERAAREAGYFVSIASAREPDVPQVREAVRRLREQAVEGIVTLAPVAAAWTALRQEPLDVPIVVLGIGAGPGEETEVPTVSVDNATGAALATRHLLQLGHRTVHHIAGPANWPEARERLAGWRSALEEAGRAAPPPLSGDWSAEAGYTAGQDLAARPEVTAVFCANDQMAIGTLRALHEAGRTVPRHISVVGFDDVPEAPYLLPPLTTVRQDFAELGRHSLDLLVEQISTGARRGGAYRTAPRLIVRSSTAPLAS